MDGKPAVYGATTCASAIDLPELPAVVAALTSAVEVGVAAIAARVDAYFERRPEAREDPATQSLSRLPELCGDLSTLGDDYIRLAMSLADPGPFRVVRVDLLHLLRETLAHLPLRPIFPAGPLDGDTDPDRLAGALSGFLGAFPELSDPASGSTIQIERRTPGWAVQVSIPGRSGAAFDRGLLGEKTFPMPPAAGGALPEEDVEFARCREILIRLGARLSSQIGRTSGVSFRLEFP